MLGSELWVGGMYALLEQERERSRRRANFDPKLESRIAIDMSGVRLDSAELYKRARSLSMRPGEGEASPVICIGPLATL